jgi:signal transduction histidine kinase
MLGESTMVWQGGELVAQFAQNILPPASSGRAEQQAALEKISAGLHADVSLFAADRSLIATVGAPLTAPEEVFERGQSAARMRHTPAWTIRLPDGRWLVARRAATEHAFRHVPGLALLVALVVLFIVVAIAAHPVVRRLTRRLERLQNGVETLGRGDLSARVKVEGRDEIARLAMSFNRAAARIEELLDAHKMLLANASHELRTPLTRIRMGVELMKTDADPARRVALERDIAEIDELIEGILLSSRLDALTEPEVKEELDLLALAAEECARYEGCSVDGESVTVHGDPILLRRLVRNLVENALRHGKAPVSLAVTLEAGHVALRVSDQGPGIATSETEAVFEPFHRARSANATGTGLGLSLVRKIARHHGGDARIEKSGPGGLTVLVTL